MRRKGNKMITVTKIGNNVRWDISIELPDRLFHEIGDVVAMKDGVSDDKLYSQAFREMSLVLSGWAKI